MISFKPTEDRILAKIQIEEYNGDIHGFIETIGPDVKNAEYGDTIIVRNRDYHRMTIEGVECVLFRESSIS